MTGGRKTTRLDQEIGEKIRRRRTEKGVSQQQLAEQMGITCQQIQKYEYGVNRVSASMLVGIAEALSVRMADLLPTARAVVGANDSGPEDIAQIAENLSPESRRVLMQVAKSLMGEHTKAA